MKTKLRLLLLAAAGGTLLSSCVVDPYGMPVAGVGYSAPAYSNVSYHDSGYWGGGYSSPFLFPASTSFTYVRGGYGRSCGRPVHAAPSCSRPVYISPARSCPTGGSSFFRSGGSHHHRSSSFPGIAPKPSFHTPRHGAPSARPALPSRGVSPFFSQGGSASHGGGRPSFATLSSSGGHHPGSGSSSHGHARRH
ncbi:MAG: hypothetical protein CJBNEKGG_03966 [Prosthecobacter sp.]|nr:hypothetical protein [Prosthecobacter sp.]